MIGHKKESWKDVLQELKTFAMRDLQDYRLADFYHLSAISRRLLLLICMPIVMLFLFFLWRYFVGGELLTENLAANRILENQVKLVIEEVRQYQDFLKPEKQSVLLQQKIAYSKVSGHFSKTDFLYEVEGLLQKNQLTLLSLLPKREVMMIDHSHVAKSAQLRRGKPLQSRSLIDQLEPLTSDMKILYLDGSAESEDMKLVPKFEMELSICGKNAQVLTFLHDLQKNLSNRETLPYLDQLQVISDQESTCLTHHYEMRLQFYDLSAIRKAYQEHSYNEAGQSFTAPFPKNLKQVQSYLTQLTHNDQMIELLESPDHFFQSMQKLFQEESGAEVALLNSAEPREQNLIRWNIGETYQEMILTGIVAQDSNSFAIVKTIKGQWKTLKLGDLNILKVMPNYLLLDSE